MNFPTWLTLSRVIATPIVAFLIAMDGPRGSIMAAALLALAAATDWLDGYLARKWNQTSKLGAMLDPIADKLIVVITLAMLMWLGVLSGWHVAPAIIILGREILVSGLREAMAGMNAPRIPSSFAAKMKTAAQMVALILLTLGPAGGILGIVQVGQALLWVAAGLTGWTGAAYLRAALTSIRKADAA
jgi:CDP-diacylglycerol--glycerol-3-phosphate 3-phosphatidyltransferase